MGDGTKAKGHSPTWEERYHYAIKRGDQGHAQKERFAEALKQVKYKVITAQVKLERALEIAKLGDVGNTGLNGLIKTLDEAWAELERSKLHDGAEHAQPESKG